MIFGILRDIYLIKSLKILSQNLWWDPATPISTVNAVFNKSTPWFSHDLKSLSGGKILNLPISISSIILEVEINLLLYE